MGNFSKNYLTGRCILGIIGSIVAIIFGIYIVVEGIKASNPKGYLMGGGAIAGGILGIIICVALLKSANKKE